VKHLTAQKSRPVSSWAAFHLRKKNILGLGELKAFQLKTERLF
jgi:hypothetical protein